jgi:hypothetical protein
MGVSLKFNIWLNSEIRDTMSMLKECPKSNWDVCVQLSGYLDGLESCKEKLIKVGEWL